MRLTIPCFAAAAMIAGMGVAAAGDADAPAAPAVAGSGDATPACDSTQANYLSCLAKKARLGPAPTPPNSGLNLDAQTKTLDGKASAPPK